MLTRRQLSLSEAARLYGVKLIDYEREGDGVLVAVGAGLMMAVMDACPRLRWCCDVGTQPKGTRVDDFMVTAERSCLVAFCGWFSITDPAAIKAALAAMTAPVVYAGHLELGAADEARTLSDFIRRVNAAPPRPPLPTPPWSLVPG